MLKAGVPLMQSFDIVGRGHANPSMARLMNDIRMDVETGTSLNQAFRKYPLYFDPLFCNLVAAGEQAGILETLLDRLAMYQEKTIALKGKIKKALFYPIDDHPGRDPGDRGHHDFRDPVVQERLHELRRRSAGADTDRDRDVRLLRQVLVHRVRHAFGGIYFLVQAWRRSPKVQATIDRLLLKLPVLGEMLQKASIARWSRTLATTFAAGVPLVEALDSVGPRLATTVYKEATKSVQTEVNVGTSLAQSMQNTGVFPNMAVQMTQIGEESGSLDSMLSKVADYYEREVDETVDALSSLLEPMIMVILGVIIGGIVIAIYMPIFKLGQVV